jgi:hypothetical protein
MHHGEGHARHSDIFRTEFSLVEAAGVEPASYGKFRIQDRRVDPQTDPQTLN